MRETNLEIGKVYPELPVERPVYKDPKITNMKILIALLFIITNIKKAYQAALFICLACRSQR